ncbi:MAG: glycosyltransferase [Desulfobacteraceae bacterium]|nr:MAG: glycosyltransferase [Desulfobacteraceae bacterium]
MTRLRILTLSPGFPYPPDDGTKIQTFNRIRFLAARNEVTLLSVSTKPPDSRYVEVMRQYCGVHLFHTNVRHSSAGPRAKLGNLVRSLWGLTPYYLKEYLVAEVEEWLQQNLDPNRFDVVEMETLTGLYMRPWWPALKVYINHCISPAVFKREFAVQKGLLRKLRLLPYGLMEGACLNKVNKMADLAVALTPQSESELRALHPAIKASNCLTNGVDLDYFHYRFTRKEPRGFAFVGLMSHPPNIDAVIHFYQDIFPLIRRRFPDMKFFVVGSSPPHEIKMLTSDPSVVVTGRVEDVREYLLDAGIAVIPTRAGGGILNKILESLALGVPVITRSNSVEGLSVHSGKELLIADEPSDFADAAVRMVKDADLRMSLSSQGRKYVERCHQWEHIVRRYEDALRDLLERQRREQRKGVFRQA